jgi:hypothetical protein
MLAEDFSEAWLILGVEDDAGHAPGARPANLNPRLASGWNRQLHFSWAR